MSEGIKFISVDMQNDFALPGGISYEERPCVDFVGDEFIPFLKRRKIDICEIMSDYRQPRRGDPRFCCRPGKWGFESIIDRDIVKEPIWIKSMNDPTWIREGGGDPECEPGEPYQDPDAFDGWLDSNVGHFDEVEFIVLFGLTADRCVLCTTQQLAFRGYEVRVLSEGTDMRSGDPEEKRKFLKSTPFRYWGESMSFDVLEEIV